MHETQINFSIVYNLYTTPNPECSAWGKNTELCEKCQKEMGNELLPKELWKEPLVWIGEVITKDIS